MIVPSDDEGFPVGAFRLGISGSWAVRDFYSIMENLNDGYEKIASIAILWSLLREEDRQNENLRGTERGAQQDWSWHNLYNAVDYSYEPGRFVRRGVPLSQIIACIKPFITPLEIDALRLESPGWIQVIGNLNPLKVIADFISKWRAENTKRLKIEADSDVERERIRTESATTREHMRKAFVLEVLKEMPPQHHDVAVSRLPEIIDQAITPTMDLIENTATDIRVCDAEIVAPGLPLPKPRPRKRR